MKRKFLVVIVCLTLISVCCATAADSLKLAPLILQAARYQSGESLSAFRQLEVLVQQSLADAKPRAEVEKGLIELAGPRSSFEARRFACKQLGIIGTGAALPALAEMLQDHQTAGIACLALTEYPRGQADQVLRTALKSQTGMVRVQIINTLGDRRDPESIKLLASVVQDADPAAAEAAATSLGKIGTLTAYKTLRATQQKSPATLASAVYDAMLRCAERLATTDKRVAQEIYESLRADSQPAHLRRGAFEGLCRLDKDQGEERVLGVLQGTDATLRPVAIAQVRWLRSPNVSERFARELQKLPSQEQAWMIGSLAARGDASAQAAIGESLNSEELEVRRAAITALSRIGDASTVPLLAKIFARSDAEEARAVESALVDLGGGSKTDAAIVSQMEQAAPNSRARLITVLARRQGPAANPVLLQQSTSPEPAVAQAALRALARTGTESEAPALLARINGAGSDEVRAEAESAAAQVLSRTKDPSSRSRLVINALKSAPDASSRAALLALLPQCGDIVALVSLKSAASNSDTKIREAAVRALAEWPDISAWDNLAAVYRQPESEALRGVALRGLVRLAGEANAHPDSRLAERYMQLLAGARGDADLKLILGALAGAAHPEMLQLAVPLLSNSGVRAEAQVAVKKIAEAIKADYPEAAKQALQRLEQKQ